MPYIIGLLVVVDLIVIVETFFLMRSHNALAGFGIIVGIILTWAISQLTGLWMMYSGSKDIYKDFNSED